MAIQFPIELDTPNLKITVTGLAYCDYRPSRRDASGEGRYVFIARDDQGRTGYLRWDYAWRKRDTTVDEIATDVEAWVAPVRELRYEYCDFPVCYVSNEGGDNTPPGTPEPECEFEIPSEEDSG